MEVKVLKNVIHEGKVIAAGAIAHLEDAVAERLLSIKHVTKDLDEKTDQEKAEEAARNQAEVKAGEVANIDKEHVIDNAKDPGKEDADEDQEEEKVDENPPASDNQSNADEDQEEDKTSESSQA